MDRRTLYNQFLEKFPILDLGKLKLEEYTNLKRDNSFCYWLESKTYELSGVARKSILPMLVGLKPKVSAPEASRPVANTPANTSRMPSQMPFALMVGLMRPTIQMRMLPASRPIRMEMTDAMTDRVQGF